MKTKEQIIDEILDRGIIVDILPSRAEFKKKLMTEKLRFLLAQTQRTRRCTCRTQKILCY